MLSETEQTSLRVIECSFATGAMLNTLIVPSLREQQTVFPQRVDEGSHPGVSRRMSIVGPEFFKQPPRSILPLGNERSRAPLEENEAQQVALMVSIEPTAEKTFRRPVPAAGIPQSIETVGRMPDRLDRSKQRRRRVRLWFGRRFRIEAARKLEQISPFRLRQRQGPRETAERFGRCLYGAALFDPRAPRRADAGLCRQFLATQAWRAPAPAGGDGSRVFSVRANEISEKPSLVRIQHGSNHNRITVNIVTV